MIWDMNTGKLINRIEEAHDEEEISTMAIDKTGEWLITGAKDGSGIVSSTGYFI